MATAPFLKTRYGGYFHRDVPEEDAELTHVGPGTPGGEYLRRFWQPVCFSDELKDLPLRLKIMGEDLVAFRDKSGAAGLLELHCPHRGTSLEFGLVGDRGIRCCYHGWLFGVDGAILETPGEPADSTLKDRLFHGAYPIHEANGVVFAYMGPPEKQPPFPVYDTYDRPGYRMIPGRKYFYPCNWLQIFENTMDPAHTAFLHTIVSGAMFTEEFGVLPELDFVETPIGMIYVATRRVGDNVWARMVESRAAQSAAGGADLGNRPRGAHVQRPDDDALERAARRHQHDVYRIPACQRHRRGDAGVVGRSRYHAAGPDRRRHPTRRASCTPATTRRRSRSGRSRSMASSISAPPTAGSACSAVRSGAASGPSKPATTQPVCTAMQAR